ncbi:MAG: hypothetical protein HY650_02225 [Acidobacteria bacterium]|nr:hypothetical protein [Acidobacteriota bacterium]
MLRVLDVVTDPASLEAVDFFPVCPGGVKIAQVHGDFCVDLGGLRVNGRAGDYVILDGQGFAYPLPKYVLDLLVQPIEETSASMPTPPPKPTDEVEEEPEPIDEAEQRPEDDDDGNF